ncbi:hypothetical protein CSC04_1883 [Enterobacter roggenkampii]|nr:hypothetical protein CSC04_1883 [Enterobacter roggenkampii]GJK16595.1 hypothetical protein TUM16664_43720 [Enterobacter cloacae]
MKFGLRQNSKTYVKPVKVAQSLRYDVPIRPFFKVMVAGFTELYGVAWPLLIWAGGVM